MMAYRPNLLITALLLGALAVSACGSDDTDETSSCPAGESLNPISGECEPRMVAVPDTGNPQDAAGDTSDMGTMEPDQGVRPDMERDLGCTTDDDDDGALSMACGGTDCDDNDPYRSPLLSEICDAVDNDCSGEVNDGIDCGFYAQSNTKLYRVEPFRGDIEELGDVPGLTDIDTHPDGTLYGITFTHLYRFDESAQVWVQFQNALGNIVGANGMAIDADGTVFITSGNDLYTADLTTGIATLVGEMGGAFSSSGDCVVTKDRTLLMTSSHTNEDSLIQIDGRDAMSRLIGVTGEDAIWGLTAAYNRLYGLTSTGRVVEIDQRTGETTLVHAYDDVSFYGAASTPSR